MKESRPSIMLATDEVHKELHDDDYGEERMTFHISCFLNFIE